MIRYCIIVTASNLPCCTGTCMEVAGYYSARLPSACFPGPAPEGAPLWLLPLAPPCIATDSVPRLGNHEWAGRSMAARHSRNRCSRTAAGAGPKCDPDQDLHCVVGIAHGTTNRTRTPGPCYASESLRKLHRIHFILGLGPAARGFSNRLTEYAKTSNHAPTSGTRAAHGTQEKRP